MSKASLLALADRVLAGKNEPGNIENEVMTRRLNADILKELGYTEGNRFIYDPAGRMLFRVPDMLGSIDDALKAVPEGHIYGCGSQDSFGPWAWCAKVDDQWTTDPAHSASVPRSLVVAALRARASMEEV